MARSMTGYGIGQSLGDGLSVIVELRSVNNRFLDLHIKIPRTLYSNEQDLGDLVRNRINRGRISILVKEEWVGDKGPNIQLDRGRAVKYAEALDALNNILDLRDDIRLDHLLAADDLFSVEEDETYREQLWKLTSQATEQALQALVDVSSREGENLVADLLARITTFHEELDAIKEHASEQVSQYRTRFLQRLEELLNDTRLDQARLETEISLAADRLDISEEITRLASHIDLFESTIKRNDPVGKTLGFVLQEMGREVNTIASKSWMIEISQAAIRMKEILEQIREQVQNIE